MICGRKFSLRRRFRTPLSTFMRHVWHKTPLIRRGYHTALALWPPARVLSPYASGRRRGSAAHTIPHTPPIRPPYAPHTPPLAAIRPLALWPLACVLSPYELGLWRSSGLWQGALSPQLDLALALWPLACVLSPYDSGLWRGSGRLWHSPSQRPPRRHPASGALASGLCPVALRIGALAQL